MFIQVAQSRSDVVRREYLIYDTTLDCHLGHSKDYTALFVLRDHASACLAENRQPINSIIPHSGQDDAQCGRTEGFAAESNRRVAEGRRPLTGSEHSNRMIPPSVTVIC